MTPRIGVSFMAPGDTMFNTNNFSADFGFDLNTPPAVRFRLPPSGDATRFILPANKALQPRRAGRDQRLLHQ